MDHAILFTEIRSFFCVSVKMLRQYVIGKYTKEIEKIKFIVSYDGQNYEQIEDSKYSHISSGELGVYKTNAFTTGCHQQKSSQVSEPSNCNVKTEILDTKFWTLNLDTELDTDFGHEILDTENLDTIATTISTTISTTSTLGIASDRRKIHQKRSAETISNHKRTGNSGGFDDSGNFGGFGGFVASTTTTTTKTTKTTLSPTTTPGEF